MMDEGYIKFSLQLEDADPPQMNSLLTELNEVRTRLFDMKLVGILPEGIGYGNVSVKKGETFIISGSATGGKRVLDAADYSEVTKIDIAANSLSCRGKIKASSESMSHAAVYNALESVNCVIHIHNREIFDCMIEQKAQETPADAAYGTVEIAEAVMRVASVSDSASSLVMRGHQDGVLSWGSSVNEAMEQVLYWYKRAL